MRFLPLFVVAAVTTVAACAAPSNEVGSSDDNEVIAADNSSDPAAMPKPILDFLDAQGWGNHHLEWHNVRQWDAFPDQQADMKAQHWTRADVQEGAKGNGLEFLAMHRVMIRLLGTKFPEQADLFKGFSSPPLTCKANQTLPCGDVDGYGGAFEPEMEAAIDTLTNHLDQFETDDDLGLFLETARRWTKSAPNGKATEKDAGLHNYLHVRFGLQKSPVTLLDPSVNLQNRHFWQLHGWIESRWTAFRALKGFTEDDPTYQAALRKGEAMFAPARSTGPKAEYTPPVPATLKNVFQR